MYQKFLFPTDGSADAEAALEYLIPLAASTGGEVVILEVVESGAAMVGSLTITFLSHPAD